MPCCVAVALEGGGKCTIDYGNSWREGQVALLLNNQEIDSATPSTLTRKTEFWFTAGAVLSLRETKGIIVINSLVFQCCNVSPSTKTANASVCSAGLADGARDPAPRLAHVVWPTEANPGVARRPELGDPQSALCGSCQNPNIFRSKKLMEQNGWDFDWQDGFVFKPTDGSFCKGVAETSYCGFHYPGDGSITCMHA